MSPQTCIVDEVTGLSIVEIPLYIPTDVIPRLPPLSQTLYTAKMQSAMKDIWCTEDKEHKLTLNKFRVTNSAPQLSEAQVLRSIRAGCETDILDLEADILRMHKTIAELSQKLIEVITHRAQKQNLANVCTSFLSPLRRLPQETLGEIFSHCVPSHDQRPVSTEVPLTLSHVCSSWRRAASGFPPLWSNLSLTTTTHRTEDSVASNQANMMKLWLSRARNTPLAFEFHNRYNSPDKSSEDPVVEIMVHHANRFKKLKIVATSVYDIRRFLMLLPGHVNQLESLHLEIQYFFGWELVITAFEDAQVLQEVVLDLDLNVNPHWVPLPWSQMTNITISSIFYDSEMLDILDSCEQLVSGIFSIRTSIDSSIPSLKYHPLKHLAYLKILLVLDGIVGHPINVFDMIAAPALTTLELDGGHSARLADISLAGFLQRAQGLQSLALKSMYATSHSLLALLQSTPRLVRLILNIEYYNPLIETLNYREQTTDGPLCVPSLEHLDLHIVISVMPGEFEFAEHEFVAMVRSRQVRGRADVAYLNVCLRICAFGGLEPDSLKRFFVLEGARDNGEIEIDIRYVGRF